MGSLCGTGLSPDHRMTGTWKIQSDYNGGWTGQIVVTNDYQDCAITWEDGSPLASFEEFDKAQDGVFKGRCYFSGQDDGTYACDNFIVKGTYGQDTAQSTVHPDAGNEDTVAANWKWTKIE